MNYNLVTFFFSFFSHVETVLEMEMSVPFSRGTKVIGQTTEYCVEIVVSGRLTQTWLRYSELRELSQALKSVKGKNR